MFKHEKGSVDGGNFEFYINRLFDLVFKSNLAWEVWPKGNILALNRVKYEWLCNDIKSGMEEDRSDHESFIYHGATEEEAYNGLYPMVESYVNSKLDSVKEGDIKVLFWRRYPDCRYENGEYIASCRLSVFVGDVGITRKHTGE